jgi:hypothetical protein
MVEYKSGIFERRKGNSASMSIKGTRLQRST